MKTSQTLTMVAVLVLLTLGSLIAFGQNTPSDDAYTNTAAPTTNYGTATTLGVVSATETTFFRFDLSSIPTGYTSANVAKASLKLYVNAVTTAGSFNVDFVNGSWSEKTITASLSPALGTTIAASVPLAKTNTHDYILVDVTSAVGEWLNGTQANDGLALVPNSPLNASFDSKENSTQSHPPELDVVLTSLVNTCASGQVLLWNGTTWACSNAGTGTITGVTTGPGSGLNGGGTSGNVPISLNTAFTDGRYAQLGATNAFTSNQTVTGNVTASSLVSNSSLGVGTASPSAELDVFAGTAGVHAPMAQFRSVGAGDSNSILVKNGSGNTEVFQSGFPGGFVAGTIAGDGGLRVNPGRNIFFGDQNASRMELTSAGDALIGSQAVIGNTGCVGTFGGIGFGPNSLADCTHYSLIGDTFSTYLNRPTGGQIVFRENNATQMVLAAGGNVGIGTTAPLFSLHVNGMIRGETGLSLGGSAPVSVDAPFVGGGRLAVLANGNVGINNPSPQHTLDVNGTLSIGGDIPMTSNPHMSFSASYPLSFCGDPSCGGGSPSLIAGYFVPDRSIQITRLNLAMVPVDQSCQLPILYLTTALFSNVIYTLIIPPNKFQYDSGPISINVPATQGVFVQINPTGACNLGASAGGYGFVNVQYVMN